MYIFFLHLVFFSLKNLQKTLLFISYKFPLFGDNISYSLLFKAETYMICLDVFMYIYSETKF